jgi:hypothetical protein
MSGHVSAYLFQRSFDRSEMSWGYVNGRQSAYLFRLNLFADLRCQSWPVVEHADALGGQGRVRHTWLAIGLEHLVGVPLDCAVLNKQRQRYRETEEDIEIEMQRDRESDIQRQSQRQRQRQGERGPNTSNGMTAVRRPLPN